MTYNEADRKKLYDKGELLVGTTQINTIKINNDVLVFCLTM